MVIDWTSISPSNVKHPESSRSWKAVRFFHGNSYITSSRGCSLWANRMPKRLKFTVSPQISLYKQRACKIVQSQMRQISSRPKENSHMVMFTLPVGYISFFSSVNVVAFSVSTRLSWKRGKHVSNVNFLTLDQRYPTIIPDVLGSIIQYDHQPIVFARWQKKTKKYLAYSPPTAASLHLPCGAWSTDILSPVPALHRSLQTLAEQGKLDGNTPGGMR